MTSKKVCIVDDDNVFRICAKALMKNQEFSVDFLEFDNGHEALAWFVIRDEDDGNIPDVILLDIRMPEMDGWTFLNAFEHVKKSIRDKISIYLLTSFIDEIDKEKILQMPLVKGYIIKPFQDEHIRQLEKDLENS